MLHLIYYKPRIPGNSGAAIRVSACTNSMLHLIDPLFDMSDTKLKRAGLDYHDLAHVQVHQTFEAAIAQVPGNLYAFTGHAKLHHQQVSYQPDDGLLFGPEPTGLPEEIMQREEITACLRIPMRKGARSLNLTISASIALYEALRQLDFPGLV